MRMQLAGILPPLATPFREDGALDLDSLEAFVDGLAGTGLAGVLALGSNGEAVHVTPEEASAVFRTVKRAAAPGMTVLAGAGQPGTRATIEMTRRAADAGCDAVLVVTPSYYRGAMTDDALRRHYEAVADGSPVPVLLYNVPANTGLNLSPSVAAALAPHPNVAGMKDSAGDIGQLAEILRLTRGEKPFAVFCGNFGAALPGFLLGASGAILAVANVAPRACATIWELAAAGRVAEARELHLRLLPLARAVTSRHGVPGLKAALEMLGRPAGVPRAPLRPAGAQARREIGAALQAAGLHSDGSR